MNKSNALKLYKKNLCKLLVGILAALLICFGTVLISANNVPAFLLHVEASENRVISLSEEEYPSKISGSMTKGEMELVLSLTNPDKSDNSWFLNIENNSDALYVLNELLQISDLRQSQGLDGYIENYGYSEDLHTKYSLDDINRIFKSFSDYIFTEEDWNLSSSSTFYAQDDLFLAQYVTLSWNSQATITDAKYTNDEMDIWYTLDQVYEEYEESLGIQWTVNELTNNVAILKPDSEGLFKISKIVNAEGYVAWHSETEELSVDTDKQGTDTEEVSVDAEEPETDTENPVIAVIYVDDEAVEETESKNTGVFTDKAGYSVLKKGIAHSEEEAESILFADITDEEWEIFDATVDTMCCIAAEYSDTKGYVDRSDRVTALDNVAAYVDELYEQNVISYYEVSSEDIYMEYASGLSAYYAPVIEGNFAGSGNSSVSIITFDPFTDVNPSGGNAYDMGGTIQNSVQTVREGDWKEMDVSLECFTDNEVTTQNIESAENSNVLIWEGHGVKSEAEGSMLCAYTNSSSIPGISPVSWFTRCINASGTEEYAITAEYIRNSFSMDDGMVYINACYSGYDDRLADAFLESGAEVVFVNVRYTVNCNISSELMNIILSYMSGADDGIYYTADEALSMAYSNYSAYIVLDDGINIKGTDVHFDTLDEFIDDEEYGQNGTRLETRGEGEYTLVSSIRGSITSETLSADELREIYPELTVKLTSENGSGMEIGVSDNTFFFNKLDAGTYIVGLYQEGELVSAEETVLVEDHRYTPVTLTYAATVKMEGYVYDEEGEPLMEVTVSAERVDGTGKNYITLTDNKGYYCVEVTGGIRYTLTYSKEGYEEVKNAFFVTGEMLKNALQDSIVEIENVILPDSDIYTAYKKIIDEHNEMIQTLRENPDYPNLYEEYQDIPERTKILWRMSGVYSNLEYSFYDINGDGQDELIIGGLSETGADGRVFPLSVYSYDGYVAVNLEKQMPVGGIRQTIHTNMNIYTDGTIILIGTDDPFYYTYSFYQIDENGYDAVLVKEYKQAYFHNDEYFRYEDECLTQDELDEMIATEYTEVSSFEWDIIG